MIVSSTNLSVLGAAMTREYCLNRLFVLFFDATFLSVYSCSFHFKTSACVFNLQSSLSRLKPCSDALIIAENIAEHLNEIFSAVQRC